MTADSVSAKRRILIVDDDTGLASVVRSHLPMSEFILDTATDAQQALAAVTRSEEPYELALIDLWIPSGDGEIKSAQPYLGIQLAEQLAEQSPETKLIAVSLYADRVTTLRNSGRFSEFIEKGTLVKDPRAVIARLVASDLLGEVTNLVDVHLSRLLKVYRAVSGSQSKGIVLTEVFKDENLSESDSWKEAEYMKGEGWIAVLADNGPPYVRLTHQGIKRAEYALINENEKRGAVSPGPAGAMSPAPGAKNARNVFVVHGRNLEVRNSIFRFLRSIGLRPLEWSQAIQLTGKASPFIGEILDVAFSEAQAVVVLMTPDDLALLQEPFRNPHDPPHEAQATGQARPNVLFEAGMAMGRNPERTILVELGTLRPFSDIAGRHTIRLSNSPAARQELAQRLETAGCPIDLTGRDWHTEGDFQINNNLQNEAWDKASLLKDAATKAGANIVCLEAKKLDLVMVDDTFYDLRDYQYLHEHTFDAAIIEFENQPIPGRKVEALYNVEAQILFQDEEGNVQERIEGGAWVGERGRYIDFEVGRHKRLVVGFINPNGEYLEISVAQNNRDTSDSKHTTTLLALDGKQSRVYVRLLADGDIVYEEYFDLAFAPSRLTKSTYLSIKKMPR